MTTQCYQCNAQPPDYDPHHLCVHPRLDTCWLHWLALSLWPSWCYIPLPQCIPMHHPGSTIHITLTIFYYMSNLMVKHYVVTQIAMVVLLQNFAHAMTAMLSWHVQNFVVICWWEIGLLWIIVCINSQLCVKCDEYNGRLQGQRYRQETGDCDQRGKHRINIYINEKNVGVYFANVQLC